MSAMRIMTMILMVIFLHVCTMTRGVMTSDCKMESRRGHQALAKCVFSKHRVVDDMISEKKGPYMNNFKCCFQSLRVCLEKAQLTGGEKRISHIISDKIRQKISNKNREIQLQNCTRKMIVCAMGKRTMKQFRKDSPRRFQKKFKRYGICLTRKRIGDCVTEYYTDMEIFLGMDCLNKYIKCSYGQHFNGEENRSASKGSCRKKWKGCMSLSCSAGMPNVFETKLINSIWTCGGKKTEKKSMKCILNLYRKNMAISHLLKKDHVREGCFLVYGENNKTAKSDYNICVKKNAKRVM